MHFGVPLFLETPISLLFQVQLLRLMVSEIRRSPTGNTLDMIEPCDEWDKNGITVTIIPSGAGFCPSTVSHRRCFVTQLFSTPRHPVIPPPVCGFFSVCFGSRSMPRF